MIKTIIDMPMELKKIPKDERILDVYFVLEEETPTAYNLNIIAIKTNKILYVAPRGKFAIHSTGGGEHAILDVLRFIFKRDIDFNNFYIWYAENKYLSEIEEPSIINCNYIPKSKEATKEDYNKFEELVKLAKIKTMNAKGR